MSYEGPDSDVQGVPTVPSTSSQPKKTAKKVPLKLRDLSQLTIGEVAILVACLKGVRTPSLVIAMSETGYVSRADWSSGETKITSNDLDRMNRCLSERSCGRFVMNNDHIWFAKTGGSNPLS